MITRFESFGCGCKVYDHIGLSTDEKPTNVPNASTFYEMDTKTLHLFDAENGEWRAQ